MEIPWETWEREQIAKNTDSQAKDFALKLEVFSQLGGVCIYITLANPAQRFQRLGLISNLYSTKKSAESFVDK